MDFSAKKFCLHQHQIPNPQPQPRDNIHNRNVSTNDLSKQVIVSPIRSERSNNSEKKFTFLENNCYIRNTKTVGSFVESNSHNQHTQSSKMLVKPGHSLLIVTYPISAKLVSKGRKRKRIVVT